MNFIKKSFFVILLLLVLICCITSVGAVGLLVRDFLTYHTLGHNVNDTLAISALAGLNALIFGVTASLMKF